MISILFLLLCTSCKSPQSSLLEEEYRELIDTQLNYFMGQYSLEDDNREIYETVSDLIGYSTEGGRLTVYKNSDNQMLGCHILLLGEMGKRELVYYILKDNIVYIQDIYTFYSAPLNGHTLYHEFTEYIIEEDKMILIGINEWSEPVDQKPLFTIGEIQEMLE